MRAIQKILQPAARKESLAAKLTRNNPPPGTNNSNSNDEYRTPAEDFSDSIDGAPMPGRRARPSAQHAAAPTRCEAPPARLASNKPESFEELIGEYQAYERLATANAAANANANASAAARGGGGPIPGRGARRDVPPAAASDGESGEEGGEAGMEKPLGQQWYDEYKSEILNLDRRSSRSASGAAADERPPPSRSNGRSKGKGKERWSNTDSVRAESRGSTGKSRGQSRGGIMGAGAGGGSSKATSKVTYNLSEDSESACDSDADPVGPGPTRVPGLLAGLSAETANDIEKSLAFYRCTFVCTHPYACVRVRVRVCVYVCIRARACLRA